MTSMFYNFARKNYLNGKITADDLTNYVTKGLITEEEKTNIMAEKT